MTAAGLAAVLTAAASLIAAITALVHSIQTRGQLASHVLSVTGSVARAARPAPTDHVIDE